MNLHITELELPRDGSVFTIVGQTGYYWNDNVKPTQNYGPFVSIYDAVNHYKLVIQDRKVKSRPSAKLLKLNPVKNYANNVIQVDFKAKKRIA